MPSFWSQMWLRKPYKVIVAEEVSEKLERNLSLWDLLSIGIGGTVGSGVFVLTGLIAHKYAGPGVILSWLVAGFGCIFSGLSYAEMASRVPSAGSSYAYAYYALGELPAVVAAWCLCLEYGLSGSAVARSWGEKVIIWWEDLGYEVWEPLNPPEPFNLFAGVMQGLCVLILLFGVSVGKLTVNFFTILKMAIVIFMIIGGFSLYKSSNVTRDFMPHGFDGVMRGATSAFFGYLGYDEVCCLACEAQNPKKLLPLAVMGTIAGVTILYGLAATALVGMQYYENIDKDSGFSQAFKHNGWEWANQIVAVGEIVTLPLVVLISFLAQPRLQFAMAEDGLLPKIFCELDAHGNLRKGILISGIVCTMIAVVVPFKYLDDMISGGILLSFNLTNSSLILIRKSEVFNQRRGRSNSSARSGSDSDGKKPTFSLAHRLVVFFNVFAFVASFLWAYLPSAPSDDDDDTSTAAFALHLTFSLFCTIVSIVLLVSIDRLCPNSDLNYDGDNLFFMVPYVPYTPAIGIFFNYFLVAQLEWYGICMIFGYMALAVLFYFAYGIHHSEGNNNYWSSILRNSISLVSGKDAKMYNFGSKEDLLSLLEGEEEDEEEDEEERQYEGGEEEEEEGSDGSKGNASNGLRKRGGSVRHEEEEKDEHDLETPLLEG